jgi:ABC-2 type transport system ATP-binding protein
MTFCAIESRPWHSWSIIFQHPTLDLEVAVTGNLLFHAELHGIPCTVAKTRIDTEVAVLGLAGRARDKVMQLSGGSRLRIELARALLHQSRVLLMGESTVGLDPATRSDLLRLILTMRGTFGRTALGDASLR